MPLVSLHNQLMSTADQVNVICRIELRKKNYYNGIKKYNITFLNTIIVNNFSILKKWNGELNYLIY